MLECIFVMDENAVIEKLFIVLQVHCDRYECKLILNVKLVVKFEMNAMIRMKRKL